jgi:phosphate/sulfate permease
VLVLAAVFVAIGVNLYGENVIKTIGQDLTGLDFEK